MRAVTAQRKHERNILRTAARSTQLIQKRRKNAVRRHRTRYIAGDNRDFFARTHDFGKSRRSDRVVQRANNLFFIHKSLRNLVCHQHAHQVFLGQFDGLNARSESKFKLHAFSSCGNAFAAWRSALHNRQLFTGQEANQRAAAGARYSRAGGHAKLLRCGHAVAAADDGIALGIGKRMEQRLRPKRALSLFKYAHRAVREHGLGRENDFPICLRGLFANIQRVEIRRNRADFRLNARAAYNLRKVDRQHDSIGILFINALRLLDEFAVAGFFDESARAGANLFARDASRI